MEYICTDTSCTFPWIQQFLKNPISTAVPIPFPRKRFPADEGEKVNSVYFVQTHQPRILVVAIYRPGIV